MKVTLSRFKCLKCGKRWIPRVEDVRQCPRCKTAYWDKETKQKARSITTQYIKKGIIKKEPCEVCGSLRSHAHHVDYNNPKKIKFLCSTHHRYLHACNNAGVKSKAKCPSCESLAILTNKDGKRRCRVCGKEWKK